MKKQAKPILTPQRKEQLARYKKQVQEQRNKHKK